MTRLTFSAALAFGLLALVAAACAGSSATPDPEFPDVLTLGEGDVFPVITNRILAVGENRFAMRLVDSEDAPILDARVRFRFFALTGEEAMLKSEANAEFIAVELFFIDESGKETRYRGGNGVYVATVNFDEAGRWGVEVNVTLEGESLDPIPFQFDVQESSPEPVIGDPAPRSRQRTLAEVDDLSQIDSSLTPDPYFHDTTAADGIDSGKPVVILFGTPAFCETQICGPVMETVMLPLHNRYKDQVIFIHVEPYFLEQARKGIGLCPVPAFNLGMARTGQGEGPGPCPRLSEEELSAVGKSWNLTTEPILFIADRKGLIIGRFEGIVGQQEVERVLQEAFRER